MLIGEISRRSQLTRDTIRFYEKKGLISLSYNERRDNNYKEYSEEILEKLITIKRLKGFGFTLNEASEILEMITLNEATCNNISHKISQKVDLLDEKLKELTNIRSMLIEGAKKCRDGCIPNKPDDNCLIIVPESA